jgi:hypothetical protein
MSGKFGQKHGENDLNELFEWPIILNRLGKRFGIYKKIGEKRVSLGCDYISSKRMDVPVYNIL